MSDIQEFPYNTFILNMAEELEKCISEGWNPINILANYQINYLLKIKALIRYGDKDYAFTQLGAMIIEEAIRYNKVLGDLNFQNLVHFYYEELKYIRDRGKFPIITGKIKRCWKTLVYHGILKNSGASRKALPELTDKGLNSLERVESKKRTNP